VLVPAPAGELRDDDRPQGKAAGRAQPLGRDLAVRGEEPLARLMPVLKRSRTQLVPHPAHTAPRVGVGRRATTGGDHLATVGPRSHQRHEPPPQASEWGGPRRGDGRQPSLPGTARRQAAVHRHHRAQGQPRHRRRGQAAEQGGAVCTGRTILRTRACTNRRAGEMGGRPRPRAVGGGTGIRPTHVTTVTSRVSGPRSRDACVCGWVWQPR
jgi:hypothetical protein